MSDFVAIVPAGAIKSGEFAAIMSKAMKKYEEVWCISLTDAQRERVYSSAKEQVVSQLRSVGSSEYEIGSNLKVSIRRVEDHDDEAPEFVRRHNLGVVEVKKFDGESLPTDAFRLEELENRVGLWVNEWLETAVKYGVASYDDAQVGGV